MLIQLILISINACMLVVSVNFLSDVDEMTSAEIMAHCRAAMEPPVQMTVSNNGIHSLVYRKRLNDNLLAVRVESMVSPSVIQIAVGDQSFELLPEQEKAIDSSILVQSLRSGIGKMLNSVLANDSLPSDQDLSSAEVSTINGRPCWIVKASVSMRTLDAIASLNKVLQKENLPAFQKYFIAKPTGLLIQTELYAINGRLISRVVYSDIQKVKELPDELFLIPSSYTLLSPQSREEYFVLRQSLSSLAFPKFDSPMQPKSSLIARPWEHFGIDESEFNRRVERSRIRERERIVSGKPASPEQANVYVSRFFITNCSCVIGFVCLIVFLRWRSRRFLLLLKGQK